MASRHTFALVLVLAVAAAGCGGGSGEDSEPAVKVDSAAAAPASVFPAVRAADDGIEQTLADVEAGGPELAPSVSELRPGSNRVGFGLFDEDGTMPREAQVALYTANADGTKPRGPFPARRESLAVGAAFRSEQTANDATPYVYVASVPFTKAGGYGLVAVVRRAGKLVASAPVPVTVGKAGSGPPEVGHKAPKIETLTPDDVGGDISKLTTRKPPLRSLVDTNVADVLGHKPVVIAFATPQLCQTRVCGPVVDLVAQLQSQFGDRAAFVQQEVYKDDKPARGLRPQLETYRLKTEPWTFVIDRSGVISARYEGAFSAAELEASVRAVAP